MTLNRFSLALPESGQSQSDCSSHMIDTIPRDTSLVDMATTRVRSESELSAVISTAAASLGYSKLKPKQYEAVKEFVCGRDVFVCLPTASGKSLCYAASPLSSTVCATKQVPCTSLVIVVSPLIALMKDQVETFMRKGLKAVYASSDEESKHAILTGGFQLVYLSPESLLTDREWRVILEGPLFQDNLVALVIDEAHCVKKWYVFV